MPAVLGAEGVTRRGLPGRDPTTKGNSEPGIDRYLEIAANPNPDAQCGTGGGSGAFGYFGKGKSLAGGADRYQTGINNSSVCGHRP